MQLANFNIGKNESFFLISGPCVIESEALCEEIAGKMCEITSKLKINYVFKASFDKANRSSIDSFRGPGIDKGLAILSKIKQNFNIPVLTDVHEYTPIEEVATVVDILQTPAFLCRQTDFIQKVCMQQKPVNIKKGQFLSPYEVQNIVNKALSTKNSKIMICERGTCFGYNNLVADMRSLAIMRKTNCPIIFDATHSVQQPGGLGKSSGGQREFVPTLAKAAVAVGIDGIFMETHPNPDKALSDGPNCWPLNKMESLLNNLKEIDNIVKNEVR